MHFNVCVRKHTYYYDIYGSSECVVWVETVCEGAGTVGGPDRRARHQEERRLSLGRGTDLAQFFWRPRAWARAKVAASHNNNDAK